MTSLLEKLKKNSTVKNTALLSESKMLDKAHCRMDCYLLNLLFGGALTGEKAGFTSGIHIWAAPSRHFKTLFSLQQVGAYMQEHKDAICLFMDSEGGAAIEYFEASGVDPDRVLHTFIEDIEQLKFELVKQLNEIEREDKVIVFIDSIGNLASKKELEDAENGKSVADMTRAKALKALGRIITPKLETRDVPVVAVNHVYSEIGMFPKTIMGGGTGLMYSAQTVNFVGKRQIKDGKELNGFEFVIKAEKSRAIKEQSVMPVTVTFEHGINKYSGLLDIAVHLGYVTKPKIGWYTRSIVPDDKNWRAKETSCDEFWKPLLESEAFNREVQHMFSLDGKGFQELELADGTKIDTTTGEVLESTDADQE